MVKYPTAISLFVAGGQHHPAELVRQRHQGGAAAPALQVLLREVGVTTRERDYVRVVGQRIHGDRFAYRAYSEAFPADPNGTGARDPDDRLLRRL